MGALDELAVAVGKVAQRSGPAVVGIGARWHRGSGIVFRKDRVLTNAHNLRHRETGIVFGEGKQGHGTVLGVDVDGDLAVIEVETGDVAPLEWADGKAAPSIGTTVFAVASTYDGRPRVTAGMVSGLDRPFRGPGGTIIGGSIEHTAPLAPGSSGSALVDAQGRLLGVNTQRIGEGFYLAMPADAELRRRVEALERGESPTRPRLGVAVAPSQVARHMRRAVGLPDREGVLVRAVEEGSAAEAAGIREGDLIVSVAGRPIGDPDALQLALAEAGSGSLEIGVVRGIEELSLRAEMAPSRSEPRRGPRGSKS